jgi:hypothetical protein
MMLPITAALADHRPDHGRPQKPQNPPCDANHSYKASAPFGKCGKEGPPGAENCDDNVDNDGDGLFDEDDPDCQAPPPGTEGPFGDPTCDDDLDNDEDGAFDEDDTDCQAPPPGTEGPFGDPTCDDDLDNDEDGLTDADDPDCQEDVTPVACDNDEAIVAGILPENADGVEDGSAALEGALASNEIHETVEPLVPEADPLGLGLEPRNEVHTVNCRVVVPVEDLVDSILAP